MNELIEKEINFQNGLMDNFIIKKELKTQYQIDNNIDMENGGIDFTDLIEEFAESLFGKDLFIAFNTYINKSKGTIRIKAKLIQKNVDREKQLQLGIFHFNSVKHFSDSMGFDCLLGIGKPYFNFSYPKQE